MTETVIKNTFLGTYFEGSKILDFNIQNTISEKSVVANKVLKVIKKGWVIINLHNQEFKLVFNSDAEVKGYLEVIYEKTEEGKWDETSTYQIRQLVNPMKDGVPGTF